MKKLFFILRTIVIILFLICMVVVSSFVAVFAVEKNTPERRIYLYNYAFVSEKDEEELHMWFVKRVPHSELETGDGVICFDDGVYLCCRCDAGDGRYAFYRGDKLTEEVTLTEKTYVGKVIAAW